MLRSDGAVGELNGQLIGLMIFQNRWISLLTLGVGVCTVVGLPAQRQAAEWPQFRGLTAGAVADDPALPERWSETENVVWTVDIPGLGWSSPIVSGDQRASPHPKS